MTAATMIAAASARPRPSRRLFVLAIPMAIILALTACAAAEEDPRTCPRVAIIGDTATVTKFLEGSDGDLTDILVRASLADIRGDCVFEDDEVVVDFEISLLAERGPALDSGEIVFDYFVSVVAPDGSVLAKEVFETRVVFDETLIRSGSVEELRQTIPLGAEGVDARGYGVFLGFQLTEEELAYNRRRRR